MRASSCQRWRDRRANFRQAGELFDPRQGHVEPISESIAKAFIVQHHYSGSYPAARFRAGMYWRGGLAGVAVFSVPMNQQIIPHYFDDLAPIEGVELGRLVLLDDVPANAESWFVARAFRLLRSGLKVSGVVSYSDPVARITADGSLIKPGHVGTVYQALNARYCGRSSPRRQILAANGREVSHRALSKLRADDKGAAYAYAQLRALGAPNRSPLESGTDYVNRALSAGDFRTFRHPGNYAYTWRLDHRPQPASVGPYPKMEQP